MSVEEEPAEASTGEPDVRRRGGVAGFIRETAIIVGLSLLVATVVRMFLVQAFEIPSGSMEQTLRIGDRVLVSKIGPRFDEIHRGDVVVFRDPGHWLGERADAESSGFGATLRDMVEFVGVLPDDSQGFLIKRVVAVGGDTVDCCDPRGRVLVNGVAVDESDYLYPGDAPSRPFEDGPIHVPEGELFVMGDHRSNSGDSRWNGTVPEDLVTGRAFAVIWPVSHWSGV